MSTDRYVIALTIIERHHVSSEMHQTHFNLYISQFLLHARQKSSKYAARLEHFEAIYAMNMQCNQLISIQSMEYQNNVSLISLAVILA